MTIFAKALVDLYNIWKELNDDPDLANEVAEHEIEVFGHSGTLHWHLENLFHYWCRRIGNTTSGFVTMKGKDGERYKYIMADKRIVGNLAPKKYEFTNKPLGQSTPRIYKAYQNIQIFRKGKDTIK